MGFSKKSFIGLVAALILVFVLIQLYPVSTTNPPIEKDVLASAEAKSVLRRSCYDCHSNETRWPWYSRIAPVSWLTAKDVREGREAMNFSTWNRYETQHQIELMAESWEEIEEGEMPPWFYLPAHRDAVLSEQDKSVLRQWALSHTQLSSPNGDDGEHDPDH